MYGFSVHLNMSFDNAVDQVVDALKDEGFGVLTDIDVKKVFKEKLDIETMPYRILGVCNPHQAHRALEVEPHIGLLLPCNVVVRQENDNGIEVVFMDPDVVLQLTDNPSISEIAKEVKSHLQSVSRKLTE